VMLKRTLCGSAVIALLATAGAASAADNRDLTGVWTNQSLTNLERPQGVTQLEVSAAEAKKMADSHVTFGFTAAQKASDRTDADINAPPPAGDKDFGVKGYDPAAWASPGDGLATVNGKYRSSHIIEPADGQLPYIDVAKAKAKAKARQEAYNTGKGPYDGPEQAVMSERCLLGFGGTGGPGMLHGAYNNNYQFVLTKDSLGIDVEMAHDVRVIPIFASEQKAKASHSPAIIKRWLGDSVAWWQGNTLVVESTHVNPLEGASGPFALSDQGKVTEYLTRTGPKTISYKFTVDDPVYYTKPWTAELEFHPSPGIYEYACHEGNYGLEGMLAGARAKDAERAAAK
jgi:hypothetical protein